MTVAGAPPKEELARDPNYGLQSSPPHAFGRVHTAMSTFEVAIAIFGVVLLALAVTGTKETAGTRLLAIVISLIALIIAGLAAVVFHEGRR